jgi:ABC-2 type transport system permease protein
MTMNIFKHEFKARLGSVLTWSLSICALQAIYMPFFRSFAKDTALLNELMASFPPELLMAFGMADIDLVSILGFFGVVFLFVQICLAIQAANYGLALVSIEETEWTADFLLTRPVRRPHIMTAKLLAATACLAITGAAAAAAGVISVYAFGAGEQVDSHALSLLLLTIPVFQLTFLTVGMAISLLVGRIRSVTPYSMGLVFGLYILNAFGGLIGDLSLEAISPFKHFAPGYIVKHGSWDLPLALVSVALIVISVAASYPLYARRDIPAAV